MTDWSLYLRDHLPPLSKDPARDVEIVAELAQHLAAVEHAALVGGATAEEAAAAARAELPDVQSMASEMAKADLPRAMLPEVHSRERWWSPPAFLQDARFAYRQLRRAPGFAAAVVIILAVALGATTAVFTVVNGVLLQPLPYPDPGRLVRIYEGNEVAVDRGYVTGPTLTLLRDQARSFETVAAVYTYRPTGADLAGGGAPRRVATLQVSAGYFRALGVRPLRGREFERADERKDAAVAVLSQRLAAEVCGGVDACVGRPVTVDGVGLQVVGVVPERFRDPLGDGADLWRPLEIDTERFNSYLTLIARLRDGTTVGAASAEVEALERADAGTHRNPVRLTAVVSLQADIVGGSRTLLTVLLGAVSVVLLGACLNIANLVLARGVARERELAVRAALGAGRYRLLRQLMTENLLLACGGGVLGLVLARVAVPALLSLDPAAVPRNDQIGTDWTVVGFGLALMLVATVLVGLPSWLHVLRHDPEQLLRGSAKGSRRGASPPRLRGALVAVQVALAVALLVASGILVRSFVGLVKTNLGFDSSQVLTFQVNLPDARYGQPERRTALYRDLLGRLEMVPGVASAGMTSRLPATGRFHKWMFDIKGRAGSASDGVAEGFADIRCVDGRYFEGLGIGLIRGRLLGAVDRSDTAASVVISDAAARRYWPKGDALGAGITVGDDTVRTVVGIVKDVRPAYDESAAPIVYLPHSQFADNRNWAMTMIVRAAPGAVDLAGAIRREVARLDSNLVVHHVATLEQVVARGIAGPRFGTLLMTGFGIIGLLLAAAGIFCVLSYIVSERTSEIGIRMALGARRMHIVWTVIRGAGGWAVLGMAGGLAGAAAAKRLVTTLVPGAQGLEPALVAAVALVMLAVAMVACYVPAARAARVDPVCALKAD